MTPTTTRRRVRNRRSAIAFVFGIVFVGVTATTTRTAEASPFVIHVAVSGSGGGGGGSNQGASGAPLGGGFAGSGFIGGTSGVSPRGSVSRSQSQSGTSDGVPSGSNVEDPLSGVPVGSIDSTAHFPNTSPFGAATGSVLPVVTGSSPRSGASTTSITNNGATPGAVALLDLGGGDSLSVSKAVADSLVAAWNDVGATSSSNTDSVTNHSNGTGNESANQTNNGLHDNVINAFPDAVNGFPDLQTGLITFPGSLPGTSLLPGLAGDVAAVANPEPSTLILFGTGLLLVTRRFGRRRH